MAFGLNFAPPTSPDRADQRSASSQLGPSQRALQVLSLHLPKILGSRAVSPRSLLAPEPMPAGPTSPEAAVTQNAIAASRGSAFGGGGAPSGVIDQLVGLLTSAPPPSGGGNAFAAAQPPASSGAPAPGPFTSGRTSVQLSSVGEDGQQSPESTIVDDNPFAGRLPGPGSDSYESPSSRIVDDNPFTNRLTTDELLRRFQIGAAAARRPGL
jgi:hypothetical protein